MQIRHLADYLQKEANLLPVSEHHDKDTYHVADGDKPTARGALPYRDSSVQSSTDRPGSCAKARLLVTSTASMLMACAPIRRSIGASALP